MSPPAPAIALRDVFVSRGAAGPVLRGLSLDIAAGETLALVGRSGAGKSTLLKLINGLILPESGDVLVESRDTRGWNPCRRLDSFRTWTWRATSASCPRC
jgi:ABC-type multidrug transport system fused ATPase/permease subunit